MATKFSRDAVDDYLSREHAGEIVSDNTVDVDGHAVRTIVFRKTIDLEALGEHHSVRIQVFVDGAPRMGDSVT